MPLQMIRNARDTPARGRFCPQSGEKIKLDVFENRSILLIKSVLLSTVLNAPQIPRISGPNCLQMIFPYLFLSVKALKF